MRFTAPTPKPCYPKQRKHLGDHLRAKRIDLGLLRKEIAVRIGVDTATVTNWELGHTDPEERFIPALIRFLGHNPLLGVGVAEASVSYLEKDNPRVYSSVATRVWKALGV